MPEFLLDTSALLSHFRQELGWERVQEIFESDSEIRIASPTLTEFIRRLRDLGFSPETAEATAQTYRGLVTGVESVDDSVALAAWRIIEQTKDRLPLVDALIAATAMERPAILVHRDKHMAAIPSTLVAQEYLVNQ